MNVLSGFYSYSIMYLDPRGNFSSLRDKKQALGENLVDFTCATSNSVFVTCKSVLEITHQMTN